MWRRVGISGECICMAGMTRRTLDKIIYAYPDFAKWMAEKDREVQQTRRSSPAYPAPLWPLKITLHEYVKKKLS